MIDIKRFWTHVINTDIEKHYNYVVVEGKRMDIAPGKYFQVFQKEPLIFGIEDLTEEIDESPDWDYREPKLEVLEETGIFRKTVRLRATYAAGYENHLYFGNTLVEKFEPGNYTKEIQVIYPNWVAIGLATLGASVLGYLWIKRKI